MGSRVTLPEDLAAGWTDDTIGWYSSPPSQLHTPAIVWRPDQPFITPEGGTFETVTEQWLAVSVVAVGDEATAMNRLAAVVFALLAYIDPHPSAIWDRVDGPYLDDTTGTPVLTAAAHISRPIDLGGQTP